MYIDFFLGANTSKGFVSRYDQIAENEGLKKIYIIKGGAGTGKSTLMKKIGQECHKEECIIERIHCSSDPDSLDSIINEEAGFAVLDGTPPHVMEPKFPGARETLVNLYPCWNQDELEGKIDSIKELVREYSNCHKKASDYISLMSALLKENIRVTKECTNFSKIDRYVNNLIKREFAKTKPECGREKVRFLSAVTPNGVKAYTNTIETFCDKIYLIEDDIGVSSDYILKRIRTTALDKNLDIISSYCITNPFEKLEHIIIPQLRVAFITSNRFHKISVSNRQKRVKASRFTDISKPNNKKQYISFNKKAAHSFLKEAVKSMQDAKMYHDLLESIYIACVDFAKVDKLRELLCEDIKKRGALK